MHQRQCRGRILSFAVAAGLVTLDQIRQKMKDKGLNPDSVEITGLVVTYDETTKQFLTDNEGLPFALNVFIREDGGTRKLVLYTLDKATATFPVQKLDPNQTLFELNKQIFGSPDGFPGFMSAIKDTSKHKEEVIAELTMLQKLRKAGKLNLNMVVTVSGK